MSKTTSEALAARFAILSVALQEVARVLPPTQAAQAADAVRQRVVKMAEEQMSPAADEAITAELAPLLAALRTWAP